MSAGISRSSRHVWEQEIQLAEASRFEQPSAMDILATRADSAGDMVGISSSVTPSLLDDAINMALDIEEKQLSAPVVHLQRMLES